MAPPQFLANAGFLKLYWSVGGTLCINVIGMRVPGTTTISQTTANTVGAAVKSAFTANLAANIWANARLEKVGLRDWRSPGLPEFRDSGAAVPGLEGTTDPLPLQTALAVTQRTAFAGKRNTGRTYLPGFTELANTSGVAAAAASTNSVNFMAGIQAALRASQLEMAVVSRPSERVVITKTTFQLDGTTRVETISDQAARPGAVNDVNRFEARTTVWETQRKRSNAAGGLVPALALTPAAARDT